MSFLPRMKALCLVAVASFLIACATEEGNQQLGGAGVGALLGCVAGGLLKGDMKGCAVGAAIGAAAGWSAVKLSQYNASQVRSESQDRKVYGLTKPVKSTLVKIRKGQATPATVRPGQNINISTDYSLKTPPGVTQSDVTETWVLKKDGKVLASPPPQQVTRAPGGWAIDSSFPIPENAKPGTYVVETKVQSGTSYDVTQSKFTVES